MHVMSGPGDESTVVIDHPQEPLQLLDGSRLSKFANGRDSFWKWRDTVLVHVISEKFQGIFSQHALFAAYHQAILAEVVETRLDVLEVLFLSLTGDQEIIDVYKNEGNFAENRIHQPLEILPCIF